MAKIILKILRMFNKYVMRATQTEKLFSERLVKSKYVYEYREL